MIAIDFFCGAGGLTRGLLDAGIDVVVGIDNNDDCRLTYERNNRPSTFLSADLRNITAATVAKYLRGHQGKELLLAGCAPCQPFSTHQRSQEKADERKLLSEVSRLTAALKPEWVFIENVPGLARVKGFSTYARFQRSLADLGYEFVGGVVDAKCYGVPQTRRRLVLIASRICTPSLPDPTHGRPDSPYRTVRDAIGHLPKISAGERNSTIPNHYSACLSEINLKRLQKTPPDGGGRTDWPDELHLDCHKAREKGHEDAYGRMKWSKPAPTLTCRCFSISNGRYGHPVQDRAISLREAASIQSFPDHYAFFGESQKSVGSQIGNAVPVRLAEVMGRHILALAAASKVKSRSHGRLRRVDSTSRV